VRIDQETLADAVRRGLLTRREADALWAHLEAQQAPVGTDVSGAGEALLRAAPPRSPPLALRLVRTRLFVLVIAAAAWFDVQGVAPLVLGAEPSWAQRALLSALTGAALVAAGVALDRRAHREQAAWLYVPGLLAFSGGLAVLLAVGDASIGLVAVLHAGLVGGALLLRRPTRAGAPDGAGDLL
jgi:hypothetical protein